jgi:hypothetical protein
MTIQVQSFATQNWLITPTALAPGQPTPKAASHLWLVVLSGVVVIDLQGNNPNDWRRETVTIQPDSLSLALEFALLESGLPLPNGSLGLDLQQWAPFASIGSVFEKASSVDAGFAVDAWRASPFEQGTDLDGLPTNRLFAGVDVDVAVRNTHATLFRLGYNFTLIGKLGVFPIIE